MRIQLSDHFTYPRLLRFTLPSILMMIVTSIYGVVDGFFVSNFVGKTPFAAINLIMPFIMLLGGMGSMVGTGGSALVAKHLGMGEKKYANELFSMLVYFLLGLSVLLAALGFAIITPVSRALGATDAMLHDCVLYGRILLLSMPLFTMQMAFQSFVVTAEKPKLGLAATIAAGVTNMVLDAVLVGLLRCGIVGAAIATMLSQAVGGLLPLLYFLRRNDSLLRLGRTKLRARELLHACTNGASEFVTNIAMSFVSMLYNLQLMRYAGENGVAAYGVLMYVNFIFIGVFLGFAFGSAPIISFHYGAGNRGEMHNVFVKSIVFNAVSGVVLTILPIVLAVPLARLFVGYDAALCEMTIRAFRIYALSFLLCGINIYGSSFFTALNNGKISAMISFMRTFVFQAGCVMLLPLYFRLDGIWYAVAVSEALSAVLTVSFMLAKRRKYGYA